MYNVLNMLVNLVRAMCASHVLHSSLFTYTVVFSFLFVSLFSSLNHTLWIHHPVLWFNLLLLIAPLYIAFFLFLLTL